MTSRDNRYPFTLSLMTSDLGAAAAADAAGVDRIGIDLEIRGKEQRQRSRPSWMGGHSLVDLMAVGKVLQRAQLFVRVHPFALGGRDELDQAIDAGAQVVMLPMFHRAAQALEFVRYVGSRAKPVLLLETVSAADDLPALLTSDEDFEFHIGLNDLGISRGHVSPFAVLCDPLLEQLALRIRAANRTLAIGRVARPGQPDLPVAAESIVAHMVSLGATGSFLSQYFLKDGVPADAAWMASAVQSLRDTIAHWQDADPAEHAAALAALYVQVKRQMQASAKLNLKAKGTA